MLLDLEDPPGGDPGERADRVEVEVDLGRLVRQRSSRFSIGLRRRSGTDQRPLSAATPALARVLPTRRAHTRRPARDWMRGQSKRTNHDRGDPVAAAQPDPRRRAGARRPARRRRPTRSSSTSPTASASRARTPSARRPPSGSPVAPAGRRQLDRHRRRVGGHGHAQRRRRSTCPATVEDDGIALPGLAETNEVTVSADCRYMNTGEGLHRFVDPVDKSVYLYTQFETADAKRMFACFDQPDLKAVFRIAVTAPADWKVISNAGIESTRDRRARRRAARVRRQRADVDLPGRAGRRARTPSGATSTPTSTPASRSASTAAPRSPSTWTPSGCSPRPSRVSASTTTTSAWPYPFGKYDQCFVPEFNAGAMENAGCVTFLEDYVFRSRVTRYAYERRCETVLHEMAHMWFGDLVTMRWWDDLWLNESFATFASVLCQADRDRVHDGVDELRERREVVGVPAGPAALDPPDRRGHRRPASGRGQLRRHHLRQGRERAQAARRRTSGWTTSCPGCGCTSPSTRGATPRWPTCSPRWRRRPAATCRGGARSGWRPPA